LYWCSIGNINHERAQHQYEKAPDIGDWKQVKKAIQRKMVQP
jgi:hypothetical protein